MYVTFLTTLLPEHYQFSRLLIGVLVELHQQVLDNLLHVMNHLLRLIGFLHPDLHLVLHLSSGVNRSNNSCNAWLVSLHKRGYRNSFIIFDKKYFFTLPWEAAGACVTSAPRIMTGVSKIFGRECMDSLWLVPNNLELIFRQIFAIA